jgi:hypothetical protein
MSKWKSIKTAPKDGTHILLAVEGKVIEGWWEGERWEVVWLSCHGCGCCGSSNDKPDGWMTKP